MALRILLLADTQTEAQLQRALTSLGTPAESYTSVSALLDQARTTAPDLVLIVVSGSIATVEAIREIKAVSPETQVVVLARGPFADAIIPAALAAGARTVLSLPLDEADLGRLLTRVQRGAERRRADRARQRAGRRSHGFERMIGESPAMRAAVEEARQVASSATTSCLLLGETGTGKDLLARAIHHESVRSGGPFIELNCAAIPPNLLESELFGHERGAFTDATGERAGLCEIADGGTLFLDEVGELPFELQSKLLRFLDGRSFRRLAGTEPITVDVRIVAATNRDLAALVSGGRFRADLFYRLHVVAITLPPLKDRGGDVTLLAETFLAASARNLGRETPSLTDRAHAALASYAWPGNVRELANVIERAVLLTPGPVIDVAALHLAPTAGASGELVVRPTENGLVADLPADGMHLEDVEAALIRAALAATDGNVVRSARLLGIGRGALRSRIRRLSLEGSTQTRAPGARPDTRRDPRAA